MPSPSTQSDIAISRLEDQPGIRSLEDFAISQFYGDWTSTNSATKGIARIKIGWRDGGLVVHAFGASQPALSDWGEARAEVFVEAGDPSRIRAFRAVYDFGFLETHLQAKTEKGVLVIASFNRFKDQSGRSNYFSREFFYCENPPRPETED
jgi:hypothetical protein